MCGRFAQVFEDKDVSRIEEILRAALGDATDADDLLLQSFNIAPTQTALIARNTDGESTFTRARYGLVPSWAKDVSVSAKMINARSETVHEKPAFRGLVGSRRCVVPVSGFYEWEAVAGERHKQPWYVTRGDGEPMMLAGLWDRWVDGDERIDSFTMLTMDAKGFMAGIHHRMPVVLERDGVVGWTGLSAGVEDVVCGGVDGGDVLTGHRVGRRVNSPANDDAGLIVEVDEGEIAGEGTLWG
tara:strand:- start:233293 stop:234018 length:726 start_codon:yes stop_codon:yes gene_type:complete